MIDTDKYEGHTEGPWDVYGPHPLFRVGAFDDEGVGEHLPFTRVDIELIADAPLLLEEVKRLYREPRMTIDEWNTKPEGPCVTVYMNGCEYVGCLRLYKNEDGEVIE